MAFNFWPFGSKESKAEPKAAYFKDGANMYLAGWRPALREDRVDVQRAWADAAARAIDAVHNSGFITRAVDVSESSVVGSGLRLSAQPDEKIFGGDQAARGAWSREVEARWREWGGDAHECDAGGRMTIGQMQQLAYRCWLTYGEVLAMMPVIRREGKRWATKVAMIPPSRLKNENSSTEQFVQGVKVDGYGYPLAYKITEKRLESMIEVERDRVFQSRDRDGRPIVHHVTGPVLSSTRGISPMASVMKVYRQIDQYFDANLTSALIQTIFAATVRTDLNGISAFEGMMTERDTGALDVSAFGSKKGEWYEGAKIDLTQHGRIAHLFPGDHLEFTEAKQPGQQFDHFMQWLLRDLAAGIGVSYENATGDFRNATYSSVRMGGATEWMTVTKRRDNVSKPFIRTIYDAWLDEAVFSGAVGFPGGYEAFKAQRAMACQALWSGPARPQADDLKTAKAYQTLKDMRVISLADIAADYGQDIDDVMRQQAREREMAAQMGLIDPWAATDIKQVDGGTEAEIDSLSQPEPQPGQGNGD